MAIDTFHRVWSITAREYVRLFPKKASEAVKKIAEREPHKEIKCRHFIVPSDEYDFAGSNAKKRGRKLPFVSIYIDTDNEAILEEIPIRTLPYVIPRWVTVSGSQYAYSPATVVALPDARLLQQITLTLLEAGQKAVDPPLKATAEAISGAVNTFAGGITWVDAEYDERTGSALEPLLGSQPALNWGESREQKIEALISDAFYLNRITLPDARSGDMTAYEVQKRVEEYIRNALPLFEPMEVEYNGAVCEKTWELAWGLGAFGPIEEIPDVLRGRDIIWQFESPLQAANERAKSEAFMTSVNLLKIASELDPAVKADFNLDKSFREALRGSGAPADWIVPEKQAEQRRQVEREMQAAQQAAMMIQQGAQTIQSIGAAGQQMGAAEQQAAQVAAMKGG